VQQARITQDLISNLPEGILYIPQSEEPTKKRSKKESKNPDIVRVGDFQFNIETVEKDSLI